MTKNYFFARVFTARLFPSERGLLKLSGYWKATGPNKSIGRGTQVADCVEDVPKGIFLFLFLKTKTDFF